MAVPGAALPATAVGIAAITLAATFAAAFWRQTRTRDATSVDATWSASIGVLGVAAALAGTGSPPQRWLAAGLAVAWSGRLTWHLLRDRVLSRRGEDGRYRALRERWGPRANRNFVWFYAAQAAIAFLFALPFGWIAWHDGPLRGGQWAGVALAAVAQSLETVADRQLAAHRADSRLHGRACRRGLWRWSRHPNYFFEWLVWCGIALAAAPAAGWLAALQPAVMFVLVRHVSGVPFAERQAMRSRGDDYRRYRQETNTFVPWLQRRPTARP